jgi:hypothetical protein
MHIQSSKQLTESLQGVDGSLVGVRDLAQTVATAGDVTYTAAQVLSNIILRDPNGGARADLFPTAAAIIAALKNPTRGSNFIITVRNTADAAETITMTTNTGLTLSGTMTIAQNAQKDFLVVVTSATTCTIYSKGSVTF